MCHHPPGTDVCITFKSSLMRGRFTYRPFVDSHPDLAEFDSLSCDDYDGGASLAEDVKGRAVGSLGRGESPEAEVGTSCPKKPRTTVRKRRASDDVR